MDILPSITARKAYNARKALTPAFQEYYDKGLDRNANGFIKGRAKAARAQNWTNNDLAGFEITICFAGLTNTVPNAFSMLSYVLSDRDLTADICEELRDVTTRTKVDGIEHVTIDITAFNYKCPLLLSSYNESLRLCVNATPVRVTTQDVVLKDIYHLNKGGIVQVTGGAMHESRKVWGNDVDSFNGRRFLSKNLTREQKKHLLPFGGGKHLCPGRHLAYSEIVSFVAMVVLGYEVEMKDRSGLVRHPGFKLQQMGENSKKPAHDVEVLIRRKQEFKDVVWGFAVEPHANTETRAA
jgi:cytochrome P450